MFDYLSGRQNAVRGEDPAKLNALLEAVAAEFGIAWLKSADGNPLQLLWARRDALATEELLLLGDSVTALKAANPAWTQHQISQMKSVNLGEVHGAAFELLGLNLFNAPGQRVAPAPKNAAGYDGSVFFSDASSLMLSIKNHGVSAHEQRFRKDAQMVLDSFLAAMTRHALNSCSLRIVTHVQPTASDWKVLGDGMDALVTGKLRKEDGGIWSGRMEPLPAEYSPLSTQHVSHSFVLAVPYHPNEQNNFYDNIRKGIANLQKHHAKAADDVCRTLMLRLSASASLQKCVEWANAYFKDYPETPVELILLYQAVPAANDAKSMDITHCFLPVQGPRFAAWQAGKRERRFIMRTLIGTVTTAPATMKMMGRAQQIPFEKFYVFQNARIWRYYDPAKGPVNATLSSPAPGVLIGAVIGDLNALEMIAPPAAELLLLP